MAALVWAMMGIALWHFAIFVPDRFRPSIVGAFAGAVIGALLFGVLVNGLTVPGRHDTDMITAIEAVPGAIAGMAGVMIAPASRLWFAWRVPAERVEPRD